MKKQLLPSLKMLLALTILTGVVYPLLITLFADVAFPGAASGSLVMRDGKVVGSELIGQKFTNPKYFWPRPSAVDYNPLPSGTTNWGPTADTLRKLAEGRWNDFHSMNDIGADIHVPTEMLFASGSGLDPHISPEAATLQINRVAKARRFTQSQKDEVTMLVNRHIDPPQYGLLGEPTVNVLMLNLDLDQLTPKGDR